MTVTEFFRYLLGHEASEDLGLQLVEVYGERLEARRRRSACAA